MSLSHRAHLGQRFSMCAVLIPGALQRCTCNGFDNEVESANAELDLSAFICFFIGRSTNQCVEQWKVLLPREVGNILICSIFLSAENRSLKLSCLEGCPQTPNILKGHITFSSLDFSFLSSKTRCWADISNCVSYTCLFSVTTTVQIKKESLYAS